MSRVTFAPNESFVDGNRRLIYAICIRSSLNQQSITVTTTATKLPAAPLLGRLTLLIYNNGSNAIYLGNSLVTSTNGIPILPQASITITVEDGIDVYAITSSGTSDVRILETT